MVKIKQTRGTKNDRKVLLWLDRDLIEIIKGNHFDLNEELSNFFKYQNQMFNINTEITFDSFDQAQKYIRLLCEFNAQLNTLSHNFNSIDDILVDIGMDIFDESDAEEDSDNNECDRLSSYYGALNEYQNKQKENILSTQKESELYKSIRKNLVIKKIEQIQEFYHINDRELNKIQNKRELIKFLINHIDNNKDIVCLLNYRKIYNKLGQPYTAQNISKQRYKLKSNIK
uniref:Uncharacterized protein n=1 Tax=Grateloupia filicina TaxID=31455 RepID=A0A2S1FX25_9FLOR|nr:hypothetical protein Grafi_p228 [Grateloupia filicina]AWD77327.1 hypothetical protein Grafi_p228 [Grateloupia filicina]